MQDRRDRKGLVGRTNNAVAWETPHAKEVHARSLCLLHEVTGREEENPAPDPGHESWTEASNSGI